MSSPKSKVKLHFSTSYQHGLTPRASGSRTITSARMTFSMRMTIKSRCVSWSLRHSPTLCLRSISLLLPPVSV